ncbi:TrmH family RNA methyltransferase [Opitutales bacterium ASA1]|uniref:TrmH family RNA methyltransferase n=1 Tax=Congregicoccus parvus TaxID=3081749 RepID=UPI002B32407D|nr:TrmH family RNA methyltransferase [Opitutales bacterium ASA1]
MLSKTRFHDLVQYTRKKTRAETGRFFVEGWRMLEEALALPTPPLLVLSVPDAPRSPRETALLERARGVAHECVEIDAGRLARLTDNVQAPGVAALVEWSPVAIDRLVRSLPRAGDALILALDRVADPGNAGTIVRTADWFGASGVVLGAGSVEPSNPKVVRSTMGSLFHLPVATSDNLGESIAALRESGCVSVGAALEGEDLRDFTWPERCALVIGNEANGIDPTLLARLDHRVRIPGYGRAESLNAAVAAALLAADWRRQRERRG